MKQKIVIRVPLNCDKCRSKALKVAVGISGVESVALTGQAKDQVEVVGDGIDSVVLTRRLRKKVAHAELVSVGEAKEEQPAEKKPDPPPQVVDVAPPPWFYGFHPYYHICEVQKPIYGPFCAIL